MKRDDEDKSQKQRHDHNREILRRMASGEPLWAFDSKASWFPPRPVIQKDPKAIGLLYGNGASGIKGTEPSSGPQKRGPKLVESKVRGQDSPESETY